MIFVEERLCIMRLRQNGKKNSDGVAKYHTDTIWDSIKFGWFLWWAQITIPLALYVFHRGGHKKSFYFTLIYASIFAFIYLVKILSS